MNEKEIKPVLFVNQRGKKKMCGSIDGLVISDKDNTPIPYKSLGFHMTSDGEARVEPSVEEELTYENEVRAYQKVPR